MALLEIKNLHANVEGKEILKGVNLTLDTGKINVLMGPNGSGKSTLSNVLMGHPKYEVTSGEILFDGENILELGPDERAKKGMFLSFQYPSSVPGVTISNMLRTALKEITGENMPIPEFKKMIEKHMEFLQMKPDFMFRHVNDGFSGGEKKRAEMLQMLTLNPKLAILDETDSGTDVDVLKNIGKAVEQFSNENNCVLIITHYRRFLEYVPVDKVAVLIDGKIVKEGGKELAHTIDEEGYMTTGQPLE
ncbi:MAG: Fe-S cluster assembly ATPase SufC [Candidatus Woesearchaeota archaeon]